MEKLVHVQSKEIFNAVELLWCWAEVVSAAPAEKEDSD